MTWKEIKEQEFWHYENIGDLIEGVYVDKQEGNDKASAIYTLEISKGLFVRVWGTTILDKLMRKCCVGELIKITYKGTKEVNDPRKQDVKIFKLEVWENDN